MARRTGARARRKTPTYTLVPNDESLEGFRSRRIQIFNRVTNALAKAGRKRTGRANLKEVSLAMVGQSDQLPGAAVQIVSRATRTIGRMQASGRSSREVQIGGLSGCGRTCRATAQAGGWSPSNTRRPKGPKPDAPTPQFSPYSPRCLPTASQNARCTKLPYLKTLVRQRRLAPQLLGGEFEELWELFSAPRTSRPSLTVRRLVTTRAQPPGR